jgi:hypothetical protein
LAFAEPRKDATQLPQLIIDFVRRAYGPHHFPAHRVREPPAQTMNVGFDRAQC